MAREQLEVLSALEAVETQWYHFSATVIAGMGFFCISLVTKLLGRVYCYRAGAPDLGSLAPIVAAAVNNVAFCGTLSGQLSFAWLGDCMVRKRVYGMLLMCMVLCSLASGLSFGYTSASWPRSASSGSGSTLALAAARTGPWRPRNHRPTTSGASSSCSDFGLISSEFLRRHGPPPTCPRSSRSTSPTTRTLPHPTEIKLVRPLLQRVPTPPRAPPPWQGRLVPPRHRLLLAEPLPERHLHGNPLDPQGQDHERPGGGPPHRARADAHRALRHSAGVLVHGVPHRPRGPVLDLTVRILVHGRLHARPRLPVPPLDDPLNRLHHALRTHLILCQLPA